MKLLGVVLPLFLLAASHLCSAEDAVAARLIHILRPKFGSAGTGAKMKGVSCSSWQLAVETDNLRDWSTIPAGCESYLGHYMLGGRYRNDSRVVADSAVEYALSLQRFRRNTDIWIFDVDETSLSNLPYFSQHGFGVQPYNKWRFGKWVMKGAAPPLPETLRLYKVLVSVGIKVVFLTGRTAEYRNATVYNLKKAGYHTWEKLILRSANQGGTALQYKSEVRARLERGGLRIVGNIGDQWSDILGSPEGERTFKLPDPMYYIS
ncbi:hypothetical protein HPP92_012619 [Vanilla planifolia]|uniref:Acid phosphatase 1-like n=1 Tax=Vanilla planifolia TaxID=51239 RepID=A0A835QXC7_VANPL|nr:hypothetical protein HPP92_012619 [Vanilla planifolia]